VYFLYTLCKAMTIFVHNSCEVVHGNLYLNVILVIIGSNVFHSSMKVSLKKSLGKEWRRLSNSPLVQMFSWAINWHLRLIPVLANLLLLLFDSFYWLLYSYIYYYSEFLRFSWKAETIFSWSDRKFMQGVINPFKKIYFYEDFWS
jgi:hypothetical protein